MRGTTCCCTRTESRPAYFYPRTPCGVRPMRQEERSKRRDISIHVPRAGYDYFTCQDKRDAIISIHVPRAGYDRLRGVDTGLLKIFLSTYPVRGTTSSAVQSQTLQTFLSTYPVRGTTWCWQTFHMVRHNFYPRTPCGVRQRCITFNQFKKVFLSTYPVRGTTTSPTSRAYTRTISIHVPRAGYDQIQLLCL